MKIASFFSGIGGLDLGFKNNDFNIIWANEFDKTIWETYEQNHSCFLEKRSIIDLDENDIPDVDGFIGGPPCQSWSVAGSGKGIEDKRGKTFLKLLYLIELKKPKFFVLENVQGILSQKHSDALNKITTTFSELGYDLHYKCLNAKYYDVPQDRKRVFFVGFKKEHNISFKFPKENSKIKTLKDTIFNFENPKSTKNLTIKPMDEYLDNTFSSRYMSRNRVRSWEEPSFTIPAMGRQVPLHPSAPKMIQIKKDLFEFKKEDLSKYRRLTVRECAIIQTFPQNFVIKYNKINDAYKMIGNAVPVKLAEAIAKEVKLSYIKKHLTTNL